MCGLAGTLLSERVRSNRELRAIGDLFTRLLVGSEHRGPYATGIALVNSSGDHYIDNAPVPASQFVRSRDYRLVLDRLDQNTTLLMGHTRWPTRGSHLYNRNNHPLVSGTSVVSGIRDGIEAKSPSLVCITHNGHITNYHALFRLLGLKREAEVDSEIILRLAERNLTESGIDPIGLADDLALCRGRLSAVIVATSDPTRILLVKGNQPLEVRCHRKHAIIAYASESKILDAALDKEPGWEEMRIPSWRLVVADIREPMPLVAYPIPRRRDNEDGRSRPCL